MNFLFKLFNKNQIKMKELKSLLELHAHFSYAENKDTVRLAKIAARIEKLTDELLGEEVVVTPKPAEEKVIDQNKSQKPEPQTKEKEVETPTEETVEETNENTEEEENEEDDVLLEIYPLHDCIVKNGNSEKKIRVPKKHHLKAFATEDDANQNQNAYPDVGSLELVLDDAWDDICKMVSGKEVLKTLRKDLGQYYPELKTDSDWYSKIINPMVGMSSFMKKQFGFAVKDDNVLMTRPSEPNMVLTLETDVTVIPKENKGKEKEVTKEEKKELVTVQEEKKETVEEERVDEEIQETQETEAVETEEVVETETKETTENVERDTTNPPTVNPFENFNSLESFIFEKYREGSELASKMKDEASKKAIQAEKREEARMLIQSNFEDEPWTENMPDGKWNPKLLNYHNNIIREISANRAKWPA